MQIAGVRFVTGPMLFWCLSSGVKALKIRSSFDFCLPGLVFHRLLQVRLDAPLVFLQRKPLRAASARFFTGRMPFRPPNQAVKESLKLGIVYGLVTYWAVSCWTVSNYWTISYISSLAEECLAKLYPLDPFVVFAYELYVWPRAWIVTVCVEGQSVWMAFHYTRSCWFRVWWWHLSWTNCSSTGVSNEAA